jgi:hypothetical protein
MGKKQSCGCANKKSSSSSVSTVQSSLSSVTISSIKSSTKPIESTTSKTHKHHKKHHGCKCEQLLYAPLPLTNQCCADKNLAWFAPGNIEIDPCCQRCRGAECPYVKNNVYGTGYNANVMNGNYGMY